MNITPVILCGGSGTRLWPLSRRNFPKQFLNFFDNKSLFQLSVLRAASLEFDNIKIDEILIVTSENHRFLVLDQLNDLKLDLNFKVLLEPEPKNTAPALTIAALASKQSFPNSILFVSPSDHYIKDNDAFIRVLHSAINFTKDKTIVTLGIKPSFAHTGFGYIEFDGDDIFKDIIKFKEKPNLKLANEFINSSKYAWNAGIFILKSQTWIDAIKKANTQLYNSVEKSWENRDSDRWFIRPNKNDFLNSPSDSIDYSVMEKIHSLDIDAKIILYNFAWSDLGSFEALSEIGQKDKNENLFKGDVVAIDTINTIAFATNKNISLIGVDNLIVAESGDSVLIAKKGCSKSIKKLVEILKNNHNYLLNDHPKVYRPWGWYETLDEGHHFKIKRIYVKPNAKLSYQSHHYRNEHWVVVRGVANILCNDKELILNHDESTYIRKGVKHQLMNCADSGLEIIEVQTGTQLSEEDITRYSDEYGRE
jgi:mannose-1-phosphate guanylyltransferase/mannose-6-phosphate isomerase